MGDALDRNLRMQQLRSDAAIRRIHEENAAKALSLKMQEFQMEVDTQARTAVAAKKYQLLTSPENPNRMLPGTAALESFLPLMSDPNQAGNLVAAAGLANERAMGRPPTANMQEAAEISRLRQQVNSATDPAQKAALQSQLDDLTMVAAPSGTSIETTTPDGTTTRVTTGRQSTANLGGLTTAATTDLQKKTVAVGNSIATAVNALDTIRKNPSAIGPVGMGREVIEKGQGMIGMQGAAPVSKARHQLALDFTQLAEGLRVDTGNMSLYERKQLEKVGDVTKAFETAQTAEDAMENIVKTLVGQKLRLFKAQNKLPDDETIALIAFEEIPKLRAAGLLTDAEALRWRDLKRR